MTFWWCQYIRLVKGIILKLTLLLRLALVIGNISLFSDTGNCKEPAFKIIIIAY